uniref:Uncharacterized protein n=1 Tax=Spongospora subterranea TaxID=70186 RepID=A0A0H5RLA8_9EUKA|eukprot:CRZ09504.1 hypothetical protein [Spongospora subterranea]
MFFSSPNPRSPPKRLQLDMNRVRILLHVGRMRKFAWTENTMLASVGRFLVEDVDSPETAHQAMGMRPCLLLEMEIPAWQAITQCQSESMSACCFTPLDRRCGIEYLRTNVANQISRP